MRGTSKVPNIEFSERIFKVRWKYVIHVVHNQKIRWTRYITEWVPGEIEVEGIVSYRIRERPDT